MSLASLFAALGGIFDMRPRPTGNADLDEVLLYNYLASACDVCGTKPAHKHLEGLRCDECCRFEARAAVDAGGTWKGH